MITDSKRAAVHVSIDDGRRETLSTVTNINGGKTTYHYDSDYQITKVIDPNGNTMAQNIYDPKGRVLVQTMPMGHDIHFKHDEEANQTILTERNDTITIYQKDEEGRIVEKIEPIGTEKMGFDSVGNLASITDKNGNTYTYVHGNVFKVTAPNGDTTQTTYDNNGNVVSEVYADGSTHLYT